MDFAYPPEVEAFRQEFGRYLDSVVTPELMREIDGGDRDTEMGPLTRAFWRRLGADGYLGLGWPREYGGGGQSAFHVRVLNFELAYRGLPVPEAALNTVGPAIMRVGSEEQKKEFLPKILSGEAQFTVGYTEPDAGTDLASLKTRAMRDGDHYVINGQKVFMSFAHEADYTWLAVRTDPDAPKHRGISVLIVPLDLEGVEVHPFYTMWGGRTNTVFFDNVRVPVSALVGEENHGWYYMTTQLDFERVAYSLCPIPYMQRVFDWLREVLREEGAGTEEEWTRVTLAGMAADLNALKVMDLKTTCMIVNGEIPVYEASLLKVLSSELQVKLLNDALQMLSIAGLIQRGSPGARLNGYIERQLKRSVVNMFGGGSNDVQRDIMGIHGLNLPR